MQYMIDTICAICRIMPGKGGGARRSSLPVYSKVIFLFFFDNGFAETCLSKFLCRCLYFFAGYALQHDAVIINVALVFGVKAGSLQISIGVNCVAGNFEGAYLQFICFSRDRVYCRSQPCR